MNKLLLILSFLVSLTCFVSQSLALPPCPSTGVFDKCFGTYVYSKENFVGDKYIGGWKKNKKDGRGKYFYLANNKNKGDVYSGQYVKDDMNGHGTYIWSNGDKYLGEWKNNKPNGQGTYIWIKGDKYVGEYKDNKRNGQGTYTYANGTIEEGIFKDGKFMYAKKPTSTLNRKIEGYKSFCSEIGFTPGTEKYGECVVEAMKKG